MTGADLLAARSTLGKMWGVGRALKASEIGRLLHITARDPGRSVREWELGKAPIPGPVAVCVSLWLAGAACPDAPVEIGRRINRVRHG